MPHSISSSVGAALVALSVAACLACPRQREGDLPYRTGSIELHEDGSFRKGQLREAAEIEGHPAKQGGWVRYHPGGVLHSIQLGEDSVFSGRTIPADTYVWLDDEGLLESAWLARDMDYDGVPCDGGWGKIATGFHPDGTLRYAFLSRDHVIDGVPCRATAFESVSFHPNGRLAKAELSGELVVGERTLKRGQVVRYDADGTFAGVD